MYVCNFKHITNQFKFLMFKINSNPIQNITCLSLENTTWENLHLHALLLGLDELQIDLLKSQFDEAQFKKAQNIEFYINKIYFDYDFIILATILPCTDLVAENLQIKLNDVPVVKHPFQTQNSYDLNLSDAVFEKLCNHVNKLNHHFPFAYQKDYLNVVLEDVSLNPEDIENRLGGSLHFTEELKMNQKNNLQLTNVIYKNRVPVAFCFKANNSSKKYLAWSSQFIDSILAIQPINIDKINKEEVLNTILDAINSKGIDQLTEYQKKFLQEY